VAVVSGLVLGEVSASKLVAPPGYRTYILDLFDQMHYGTEATVAGLALILIVVVGLGVLASSAITGSPDRPRSRNSHG
jgi:ABC-type Fe3+ transport system permease subunit